MSAGADAIGLVFYEQSARNVSVAQAAAISRDLPAFVNVVGLFVDATPDFIRSVLATVHLDTLQFHGDETPEQCAAYGLPFIKAIRVKPQTNLLQCAKDFSAAKALLLDTYTECVWVCVCVCESVCVCLCALSEKTVSLTKSLTQQTPPFNKRLLMKRVRKLTFMGGCPGAIQEQ